MPKARALAFPQSWQCRKTKDTLCPRSRFLGCGPRCLQQNAVSLWQGLMCKGLLAPPVTGREDQKGFLKRVLWLGLPPMNGFA